MEHEEQIKTALSKMKAPPQTGRNYGGTGGGRNAFYGYLDKNGSGDQWWHPCHGMMRHVKSPVVIFSKWRYRKNESKIARRYFDWITGPDSPWSPVLPKGDSIEVDGINVFSRDAWWKYGFIWSDLGKFPNNYLHNFLVASRMLAEWHEHIKDWDDLVENHGINPEMALLFVTMFNINYSKRCQLSFTPKYDWPLDQQSSTEEYVLNFINHEPCGPFNRSYLETSNYTPVNNIWGPTVTEPKSYAHQIWSIYHDRFGADMTELKKQFEQYGGFTKFQESHQWNISKDERLEIIKAEWDRLSPKITKFCKAKEEEKNAGTDSEFQEGEGLRSRVIR